MGNSMYPPSQTRASHPITPRNFSSPIEIEFFNRIGQEPTFADPLIDHPVGAHKHRLRNPDAKDLSGFEVDDQLEFA